MLILALRDVNIVEKDGFEAKAQTWQPAPIQTGLAMPYTSGNAAPKTAPL